MNEGRLSTDKVSTGPSDVRASKVGTQNLAHPGFRWWHEVSVLGLLILLLIVAEILVPGFLSFRSQLLLSRHLWEIAILSLAMMLVILTGGIDLSVGGIMGLSAVAFGFTFSATGNLVVSCASCLCVATMCGTINGLLVARWRLHPLIVTLATMAAFRGLAEGWSQGQSWSAFGAGFSRIARGSLFGIPYPGVAFLVLSFVVGFWLWKTPGGLRLYAIGFNETASRFSGIAVDRIRFWLFTFSGFLSGIATIVLISRFDTAKADAGEGLELEAITAVVAGGTSIFGGRGTVVGTVLGLLLIHETRQFVSRYWGIEELKSVFVGSLLIGFVLLYQAVRRGRSNHGGRQR